MSGEGSPNLCQCFSKHLLLAVARKVIVDQTFLFIFIFFKFNWRWLLSYLMQKKKEKKEKSWMLQWIWDVALELAAKNIICLESKLGTAGCRSAEQSVEMHVESWNNVRVQPVHFVHDFHKDQIAGVKTTSNRLWHKNCSYRVQVLAGCVQGFSNCGWQTWKLASIGFVYTEYLRKTEHCNLNIVIQRTILFLLNI